MGLNVPKVRTPAIHHGGDMFGFHAKCWCGPLGELCYQRRPGDPSQAWSQLLRVGSMVETRPMPTDYEAKPYGQLARPKNFSTVRDASDV